jgi:hypothetical protein
MRLSLRAEFRGQLQSDSPSFTIFLAMNTPNAILCDGCGQTASPDHIARRLQRLEWTTRFRPVHIGVLLVSAFPPEADSEFLYAAPGIFQGEAARLLEALEVPYLGKAADAVLSDFQRRGFLLVHTMDCPPSPEASNPAEIQILLKVRLATLLTRVRRSLKPRRAVLLSGLMEPLADRFSDSNVGCPVVLDNGKPFGLQGVDFHSVSARLRSALALAATWAL